MNETAASPQGRDHFLVSVHNRDKNQDLVDFCADLHSLGFGLASSSGTFDFLKAAGMPVTSAKMLSYFSMLHRLIAANAALNADDRMTEGQMSSAAMILARDEMCGGRIKTLRPEVFAPILATEAMRPELAEMGMTRIVGVRVSCYPLQETISDRTKSDEQIRNEMDIGGPSMIRATIKALG